MKENSSDMKLATIVINVNPEGCSTEVDINKCALYALDKTIHLDAEDIVNIINKNSATLNHELSDTIHNQFKKTVDEMVNNPSKIMDLLEEIKSVINKINNL